MTPGQSRTGGGSFGGVQVSGIGSAIRAMGRASGLTKSKNDPTQSQSQTQSFSPNQTQSQTQSRQDNTNQLNVPNRRGFPSIMQELELDTSGFGDNSRKGSIATSDGKKVSGEGEGENGRI